MRERITFLHDGTIPFNPATSYVTKDSIFIDKLAAAKEHRITLNLDQLPEEWSQALSQSHEFYLRWIAPEVCKPIAPFVSNASPGLHVFYTPHKRANPSTDLICPVLRNLFGQNLKCESPKKSFTEISVQSERFSSTTAFQYHQLLPSLDHFTSYFERTVCDKEANCHRQLSYLPTASYFDINWHAISGSLVVTAFWDSGPEKGAWDEQITKGNSQGALEVGILSNERPTEIESLSLAGFLTVLGQDDKPVPTLFSFPSRHHPLPVSHASSYSISFPPPTGLHPKLRITLSAESKAPSAASCRLFSYLILPSAIFADKYQLSDPIFRASNNLGRVRSLHGETDLEAPDWIVNKWGSSMLVELASPEKQPLSSSSWQVNVPLHLRYLAPSSSSNGKVNLDVPWPIVFWACNAEEGLKMSINPFDRTHLGYDGLFGPKTLFYHLHPSPHNGSLVESVPVPVLNLDRTGSVESGTVFVVVVGFLWVCWKLCLATGGQGLKQKTSKGTKSS